MMENKGGCITCRKCEQVRINFYCGRKKLSQKQLYNTHGFCSNYEPKKQIEKQMTNEEWFNGLATEEKAKRIINIAVNSDCDYRTIVEWLKQPYSPKILASVGE